MKRTKLISFKVSDFEDASIRTKAKRSNLNLSKYVRRAALNKDIMSRDT